MDTRFIPALVQLIDRTAGYLRDAGYEVVEVEPPSIMEPARGWFSVLLTELKATFGPADRSTWKRRFAPDLWLVLRNRETSRSRWLSRRSGGQNPNDARLERVPGFLSVGADAVPHAPDLLRGITMRWDWRRPKICSTPRSTVTASTILGCRPASCPSISSRICLPAFRSWAADSVRT